MKSFNYFHELIFLIIFILSGQQLLAKNEKSSKSYDEYYWEYISNCGDKKHLFEPGTYHYQIKGDFNEADSIFLVSMMDEFDSLMETVTFKAVSKSADLVFDFNTGKLEITGHLKITKMGRYTGYFINRKIEFKHSNPHSQERRNRIVQYHLIRYLADIASFGERIPSDVADFLKEGKGIICGKMENGINHNDKEILKRLYINNFHWTFMRSYPGHYLHYVKTRYPNSADMVFKAFLYCLLAIYFFAAYRLGIFKRKSKKWLSYNKMALVISLGFTLMFIFQWMYIENLQLWEVWNSLLFYILLFLGTITLLNILYLLELFLDKCIKDTLKNNVIKLFSGVVLMMIPLAFLVIRSNNLSYNPGMDWMLFVLSFLIAKTVIHYQNIKVKEAIKEKDLELANLQKLQHQAELQAIQSRINPHFLYNSLNSIASLCRSCPEKSESMALALSSFCRYAINKKDEKMAILKDEIEAVKAYLEIEKIRFSEQLEYSIACDQSVLRKEIPRFIIQPLVENAIKHGTSQIVEKGLIEIAIREENENLVLKISDNGKDFPEEPLLGYGLQSIYDKLEILYNGEAKINWTRKPEKAIIVSLPAL